MNIILFDSDIYTIKQVSTIYENIKDKFDDELIFLPKDFNVLLNCSKDSLISIKNRLEDVINEIDEH